MSKPVYIAVDFDGTVVTHDFPKVGETVPGVIKVLERLIKQGTKIILYTMRSDEKLQDAVEWFANNGIDLYGINLNPSQKVWTNSLKVYAHKYIDDAAINCPLIYNVGDGDYPEMFPIHSRPYVDWMTVEEILEVEGFLEMQQEDGEL